MQECESSIVTRYEADIPTRRDDFGDHTPTLPHPPGEIFDQHSGVN